jgi:hypothetical protein
LAIVRTPGPGEVEARGLRREEVGDVAGDERARGRHADEDRAGPRTDGGRRLLTQRGVRLVADDDRVGVGDAPGVAHEPLVGLDGDRPDAAVGGGPQAFAVEQRRRLALAVAALVQLAEELVDEVAAVREDQDAAGARRLHEAHRRDGLAGAGGVLEPEALAGVGVVGGAFLDVLVDVAVRRVVVVGLLLGGLVGLVVVLEVEIDVDVDRFAVLVLLVVVLVLVVEIGLRLGLLDDGLRLGLGRLFDGEHRRSRRTTAVGALLRRGQQRHERAGERIDLVRVQQRAVGQPRLVLAEHPLEAEQQRVAAPPLRRGHLGPRLHLGQRRIQRAAAGAAGRQRDRGVLAVVDEALTGELLRTGDVRRIGKGGCGLDGRRRGISHETARSSGGAPAEDQRRQGRCAILRDRRGEGAPYWTAAEPSPRR